eukprot:scaffold289674_cov23-Prasinocladus_malaysianus.AAC.1
MVLAHGCGCGQGWPRTCRQRLSVADRWAIIARCCSFAAIMEHASAASRRRSSRRSGRDNGVVNIGIGSRYRYGWASSSNMFTCTALIDLRTGRRCCRNG